MIPRLTELAIAVVKLLTFNVNENFGVSKLKF